MTKSQKLIIASSVGLSLLLIGGALLLAAHRRSANAVVIAQPQHPVAKTELARADGKSGHTCYVAVSGTVYLIDLNSPNWRNGDHTPSRGLAYCGADLTKVIDQAPHGRQILDTLQKVGPLVN